MIGQKGYPPVQGGIEKHVAELAARLAHDGIEVTIYSRPHYSGADGETEMPGVSVRRRPSIPTKHLDAITHTILCTVDALLSGHRILHYHALGPALMAWLPRLFRRPVVATVHGLDWQREKWGGFARRVLRVGERAVVRLPHRTIVVSHALHDHFLACYGRETECIPNGISLPVRREPDLIRGRSLSGDDYVLFVGRLVPEKGCHLLLDAWRSLPPALRDRYKLVIAGGSGFTDAYADRLRVSAPQGTLFTGFVHGPELEELLTNAALVALPSTLEGLSIALLEGMAHRRCCLVSDIPPNLEAGGDCVATFPSGDVQALAAGIARLLADPDTRRNLGAAALARVRNNYSWESAATATLAVYRSLA
jgi:glycosyltransferase involved in cell wall biosynthesis